MEAIIAALPDPETGDVSLQEAIAVPANSEKFNGRIAKLVEAFLGMHGSNSKGKVRSAFWNEVNEAKPQTPMWRYCKAQPLDKPHNYLLSNDTWYKAYTIKLDVRRRAGGTTSGAGAEPEPNPAQVAVVAQAPPMIPWGQNPWGQNPWGQNPYGGAPMMPAASPPPPQIVGPTNEEFNELKAEVQQLQTVVTALKVRLNAFEMTRGPAADLPSGMGLRPGGKKRKATKGAQVILRCFSVFLSIRICISAVSADFSVFPHINRLFQPGVPAEKKPARLKWPPQESDTPPFIGLVDSEDGWHYPQDDRIRVMLHKSKGYTIVANKKIKRGDTLMVTSWRLRWHDSSVLQPVDTPACGDDSEIKLAGKEKQDEEFVPYSYDHLDMLYGEPRLVGSLGA